MNDSNLQLELQCPQCGAGVILHETDRLFSCAFCRVKLYVHSPSPFQCYFAPVKGAERNDLCYLPYWRFRGVAYALNALEVTHRIIETSVRGCDLKGFPYSLGMRPQAVKLRYLTADVPGRFLKPSMGEAEFLQRLANQLPDGKAKDSHSLHRNAFVGETLSLIFTPFRIEDSFLYDAVTNRAIGDEPLSRDVIESWGEVSRNELLFRATLCPDCGWDMEGERDSTVLMCRNCRSAWEAGKAGFGKVESSCVASEGPPDAWLPFWHFEAALPGMPIQSRADFIRLTNIPKAVFPEMEKKPFSFWTPAFKLNPKLFLRLGQHMTVAQLEVEEGSYPETGKLFPCNLPAMEAIESLPILLGAIAPAKEGLFPLLRNVEPAFKEKRLIHVPFKRKGAEYIQATLGFALPREALQWSRAL